ncbi:hypothetical protein K1T71_009232 [Dendrolimus kikuchii]|uniref:Uncharacterized protein n=1 Tax=Dendrolimus kikuchii TaxID=765133 RepID=A0ACC1CU32_9NEOP|nr:hypothetical protein K1T71_009232 [Dendrolimus kikuchii]
MELMTSLFLCALAMPQALVVRTNTEIKYNTSKLINQKAVNHKKILLNINGPPLVNVVNDLQSLFVDTSCSHCTICMERAIRAYKSNLHHLDRPTIEELQEEVLEYRYFNFNRDKRDTDSTEKHESATEQLKTRNQRVHQFIDVKKYNINGEVYALKINESNIIDVKFSKGKTSDALCHVYSIKKYFPCNTPEAELLLTVSKRKANKKNKKEKIKSVVTTTEKKVSIPVFRKRHVDNSQVPENVMPSIEELY